MKCLDLLLRPLLPSSSLYSVLPKINMYSSSLPDPHLRSFVNPRYRILILLFGTDFQTLTLRSRIQPPTSVPPSTLVSRSTLSSSSGVCFWTRYHYKVLTRLPVHWNVLWSFITKHSLLPLVLSLDGSFTSPGVIPPSPVVTDLMWSSTSVCFLSRLSSGDRTLCHLWTSIFTSCVYIVLTTPVLFYFYFYSLFFILFFLFFPFK